MEEKKMQIFISQWNGWRCKEMIASIKILFNDTNWLRSLFVLSVETLMVGVRPGELILTLLTLVMLLFHVIIQELFRAGDFTAVNASEGMIVLDVSDQQCPNIEIEVTEFAEIVVYFLFMLW